MDNLYFNIALGYNLHKDLYLDDRLFSSIVINVKCSFSHTLSGRVNGFNAA